MYKFQVMTNDYIFLFQFAYETGAYIQVYENVDCCNSFQLCYEDERQGGEAHKLMQSCLKLYEGELYAD